MPCMTRQGFYIYSRRYNDITQRTIDGSRTERMNRESHAFDARGLAFSTSTTTSTSSAPARLHVVQLHHVDSAQRVESFSVTRRTINSHHTKSPAPSSFVRALSYRASSCKYRRIESLRHLAVHLHHCTQSGDPEDFIDSTSLTRQCGHYTITKN